MKKSTRNILGAILIIFPVYVLIQLFVPSYTDDTALEVEVPQGATYRQVVDILTEKKLIRDPFLFRVLGRITGSDRKIRAGYYNFWSRISPFDVLIQIRRGKIVEYDLTVIEGDSLPEIGEKLAARGLISSDEFMLLAGNKGLLDSLDIEGPSLEGYLFPDTYRVPKGATPRAVIKLMVGTMRDVFNEDLKKRMKKMKWSENQVLTMASIIEKEARIDSERAIISAVYHNRLRIGMPLQADPTAIYGVKSSRERITSRDLRNKTAYNTYVIRGLPPGPIASPGAKSIRAALYPADVPYIYFVARGDGSHIFTKTLLEHNAAINEVRSAPVTEAVSKANNGKEG